MDKELSKTQNKTFRAICRVNSSISLNKYESFKKYSNEYLAILKNENGEEQRLPKAFHLYPIRRGQVLTFGEETIVDVETGAIECFHKEIFEQYSQRYVELPCTMVGEVKSNFKKAINMLPKKLKKELEKQEIETTSRFRVEPILEKYTGQELED